SLRQHHRTRRRTLQQQPPVNARSLCHANLPDQETLSTSKDRSNGLGSLLNCTTAHRPELAESRRWASSGAYLMPCAVCEEQACGLLLTASGVTHERTAQTQHVDADAGGPVRPDTQVSRRRGGDLGDAGGEFRTDAPGRAEGGRRRESDHLLVEFADVE